MLSPSDWCLVAEPSEFVMGNPAPPQVGISEVDANDRPWPGHG